MEGQSQSLGYELAKGTLAISQVGEHTEWRFVAVALRHAQVAALPQVAQRLQAIEGLLSFQISHAHN